MKKQLLLISLNESFILEMKECLSLHFEVVNVDSIHVGYSLAMEFLPDLIYIDSLSLKGLDELKNISHFKSTHFLNRSWLFMNISDETSQEMQKQYGDVVDYFVLKSSPLDEIYKKIINKVYVKNSLSNYWKDCFMGMFNCVTKPVLLLEQNIILAMNDEFKQVFKPQRCEGQKLTDFVKSGNKVEVEVNLRNFSRSKLMRSTTKASLLLNNDKIRDATLNFSKLKKGKGTNNQYILTIDFLGPNYLVNDKLDEQVAILTDCIKENNNARDLRFTKREKEIIKLLCKGYKTKEVSNTLFISPKTIEKHRSNIIKKTKSDTMLESIIYAISHNLIEVNVA